MTTTTIKFGAGESSVDVTEQFDSNTFQSTGIVLPDSYLMQNGLSDATLEESWQRRYVGSGHNLGLFRDSDNCYWEAVYSEMEQSVSLEYLGDRKEDVLQLVADYKVRVWDEGFSAEWLVVDDSPVIISTGGVPESIIDSATDTLIERMRLHPSNLKIVQEYVACEFVGEDEETDSDEDHAPNCTIEDLR